MKIANSILILLLGVFASNLSAQVSGNQVYGNNSYNNSYNKNNRPLPKRSIVTTDSTLIISANILLNKVADSYLVSVGTNQEGLTVLECNTGINKRIKGLLKSLKGLGVRKEDVYVDFISQTKIYDYTTSENKAQQFEKGFEIKKNILIKLDDIGKLDRLIELCAEQEIYDLIKVDYINNDVNKTYEEMYKMAVKLIESRKSMYLTTSKIPLTGSSKILLDNFYSVYPKSQYKKYQAFESSDLTVHQKQYNKNYVRKEERKNKTFYYDGIDLSSFDKIVNASEPMVGIQYVFYLTIVYEVKEL